VSSSGSLVEFEGDGTRVDFVLQLNCRFRARASSERSQRDERDGGDAAVGYCEAAAEELVGGVESLECLIADVFEKV